MHCGVNGGVVCGERALRLHGSQACQEAGQALVAITSYWPMVLVLLRKAAVSQAEVTVSGLSGMSIFVGIRFFR